MSRRRAAVEGALKTRHVATSRERAQLNYKFCVEASALSAITAMEAFKVATSNQLLLT